MCDVVILASMNLAVIALAMDRPGQLCMCNVSGNSFCMILYL